MKKKWIILTVISLLVIAAADIFTFVYLIPRIKDKMFLDAIVEGDRPGVTELVADLSGERLLDLKEDVSDIVVYTHNQYAAGLKSYEEMYAVYDIVENIRPYKGLTAASFSIVQIPRLIESYEKGVKLYDTGNDYYKERDLFKDIRKAKAADGTGAGLIYGWDDKTEQDYLNTVDSAMDTYLRGKYDEYTGGKLDNETIKKYIYTADGFWDTEYVEELRNKIYYEDIFKAELEKVEYFENENLIFNALSYLHSVQDFYGNNEYYADWKDIYNTKCKELESKAKDFYHRQAIEYINDGDEASALYIIEQLKDAFGEDYDVSDIEEALAEAKLTDWKKAYLTFMSSWASEVEDDYENSHDLTTGDESGIYDFSEIRPDRILLRDVNGDDLPELIFDNGKNQSFVYSYLDGGCEYLCYLMDYTAIGENGEFIYEGEYEQNGIWRAFHVAYLLRRDEMTVAAYTIDQEAGGDHMFFSGKNDEELREIDEAEYHEIVEAVHSITIAEKLPFGAYVSDYDSYIRNWNGE